MQTGQFLTCLAKFPKNNKRPWPQTKDRRSLAYLAWQSRSIRLFRRIFNSRRGAPDYFRWSLFPQSEKYILRDMNPSAYLCFYSTTLPFRLQPTLPLINPNKPQLLLQKPKQTAHFVTLTRHFCTFRLWYGGRAAWSVKGAQKFWYNNKRFPRTKFLRVPVGADLWQTAPLLSRFSGRRKAQKYRKCTAFVVVLYRYRWGIIGKQYACRACCSLP